MKFSLINLHNGGKRSQLPMKIEYNLDAQIWTIQSHSTRIRPYPLGGVS